MIKKEYESQNCFLGLVAHCRHIDNIIPKPLCSREVFFAYDTQNKNAALMEQILKEICIKNGYELETFKSSSIPAGSFFCDNICLKIKNCAFMVADIGSYDLDASRYNANPNVTLEIGLAWGFGKQVVAISNSHDAPSDFQGMQLYTYPQDFVGTPSRIEIVVKELDSTLIAFNNNDSYVRKGQDYITLTEYMNNLSITRYGVHKRLPTICLPDEGEKLRLKSLYGNDTKEYHLYYDYSQKRIQRWNMRREEPYETWAIFDMKNINRELKSNEMFDVALDQCYLKDAIENFINFMDRKDYRVVLSPFSIRETYHIFGNKFVWVYTNVHRYPIGDFGGNIYYGRTKFNYYKVSFNELLNSIENTGRQFFDKNYIAEFLRKGRSENAIA